MAQNAQRVTYSIPTFARLLGKGANTLYQEIYAQQDRGEAPTLFGIPVVTGPGEMAISRKRVDALLDISDEQQTA